jgi:release factor glutamine methyltransferase
VAYIVGQKGFWSFDLSVSPDVLVPRPETECLVELALTQLPESGISGPLRVLELGTGTGAIAIALALERPGHQIIATDVSMQALQIARKNADRYELNDKIDLVCADWFETFSVKRPFLDLIIANPPYIPTAEIQQLQPEIAFYEPRLALDGGMDGLDILQHILKEAVHYLRPGGALMMEMGSDQRQALGSFMKDLLAYSSFQFFKDYSDRNRILKAVIK